MNENKTDKIFELLCELPLDKWQVAPNNKYNYITIVDGIEVYLLFWEIKGVLIYLGNDFNFHIEYEKCQPLKEKLKEYFKPKPVLEQEIIGKVYNSLKNNSVCNNNR